MPAPRLGAPAGVGRRTREGERDIFGQSPGASHTEEEPREGRREARRRGGPSRRPLNPCAPRRRRRQRPPPPPELRPAPPEATEPKASSSDLGDNQVLRALRGHHSWKDLGSFIPFLSLGPRGHRTGTEDCPKGCWARGEITSRLEGVTPESASVIVTLDTRSKSFLLPLCPALFFSPAPITSDNLFFSSVHCSFSGTLSNTSHTGQ